jgi:predicted RNA-binding protein with PIN domain
MLYLIDGYNLLHAMGVLRGRTGPHGLEKARRGLLGLLSGRYGDEAGAVTVVFDAADAPPGAAVEADYQGIHVQFAVQGGEADDVIEGMIQRAAAPRHLVVVSDDHRLQRAARHRHCAVLGCLDYIDQLTRHRRERHAHAPTGEKEPGVSAAERQHWLEEFGGLEHDPELKDFFRLDDFGTDRPG